jgi:Tfp pilus assembly protein PilO
VAKSRSHSSELEQLRQELRNLRSENKHLRKELAKANRVVSRIDDLEDAARDEGLREVKPEKAERCEECQGETTKIAGKLRILHHANCPLRRKK